MGGGQKGGTGLEVTGMNDGAVVQIAGGVWQCGSRWWSDGAMGEVVEGRRCREMDNGQMVRSEGNIDGSRFLRCG